MSLDWDEIAQAVAKGVSILAPLAPFAETLVPAAAPAISIVEKIIAGAIAAEPTAVALVKQIQSGEVPSQTQLAQYYANYQADDDALKADIEAHLTALAKH